MGVIVSFLFFWSLEIAFLVILTSCLCRILSKQPHNTHAAMWTATLCVAWLLPLAPIVVPDFIAPPIIHSVIVKSIPPLKQSTDLSKPPHLTSLTQNQTIDRKTDPKGDPIQPTSNNHLIQEANRSQSNWIAAKRSLADSAIPILFSMWSVGIGMSLFRCARSHRSVRRLIAVSQSISDASVAGEIERIRQLLFINGTIRLRTADAKIPPFVMGFFRPLIFFPQYMLQTWTPRDRQAVAAHELAHVRRYDLAIHHAMRWLRIVLWFLPPVWWMQRELHRAQDAACDECAAVVLGNGSEFGRALAHLAESCLIADPVFPALGLLHSKSSLISRLENIMNAQISQLSRLSLVFKFALVAFSCMAFFGVGSLDRAASSQTLSVEYLGDYLGKHNAIAIDSVVYAPPYYVVVGKQDGQRLVQYYAYGNAGPTLRYTMRPDAALGADPDAFLRIAVANERFLVLFYAKNDVPYYLVYDHSQVPKLERTVYLSQINGTVSSARLDGSHLYFINKKQNGTIYRHSVDIDNPLDSQWNASIPEHIITTDFDLLNGDILLSDGFGDDVGDVDPAIGAKTGVARSWIDASNHLQIDLKRWFTNVFQPFVQRIQTFDSIAVVSLVTRKAFSDEILIVDWSDKENPKIVQTLEAGRTDTYLNNGRMEIFGSLLAVSTRSESLAAYTGIDLYQLVDGKYKLAAQFPEAQGRIALGPEYMVNATANTLVFYDISDLTQPTEIPAGIESAFHSLQIASANLFLYAINQNGTQKQFVTTLDTAVPFSGRIVAQQPIPEGKDASIQAHDGFFSLAIRQTGLTVNKIMEDGSLGDEIELPPNPQGDRSSFISNVLFSDSLFVPIYSIPQPDGKTTPDPVSPELHIYRRSGDSIEKQSSSILSLTVDSQQITLSGDRLFEIRYEYSVEAADGIPPLSPNVFIYTYTLENPERPIFLSKFQIPEGENADSNPAIGINGVAPQGDFVVYISHSMPGGIVDVSDLQNPKHLAFLPKALCVFWYENLLALGNTEAILFFKIDRSGIPTEVARIDNAKCLAASVSKNRLYVRRTDGAIDIYELHLTSTGVLNWTLH